MQTAQVIRTIRWIESLFSDETKSAVFSENSLKHGKEDDREFLARFIKATQDLAVASATMSQNPDAVPVLKAFELDALIDRDFITNLALAASKGRSANETSGMLQKLISPWQAMTGFVGALETLILPEELKGKPQRTTFSVEVRYRESNYPTLTDLAKVSALLQQAYIATALVVAKPAERHMTVLKIESGPSIRIDCQGHPEIVKPLRAFCTEAWYKLRTKSLDEIGDHNSPLLNSMPIMERLARRQKENSIRIEEADSLRKKILGSVLGLFACGTVLIDMPSEDELDRQNATGKIPIMG